MLSLAFAPSSVSQEMEEIDCEGEWADSPLCKQRETAFELKSRVEASLEDLTSVSSPPWDETEMELAEATIQEGLDLYEDYFFGDASIKFEKALSMVSDLKEEFDLIVSEKQAEALGLLEAESYAEALDHFNLLAEWLPDSEMIAEGVQHAEEGSLLGPKIQRIHQLLATQQLEEAEIELSGFPEDYWQDEVSSLRNSLASQERTQSFNSLMSAGLRLLDEERYEEARVTLKSALTLEPNSGPAKEALKEAEAHIDAKKLASFTLELQLSEEQERWEDALAALEGIEQLDPGNESAAQSREKFRTLLDLESRLQKATDEMSLPLGKQVRDDIRDLLEESEDYSSSSRIAKRRNLLRQEFEAATTPVTLTVTSDGKTRVSIRPGKTLGTFTSTTVTLYPGSYEFVGIRRGFREIRQSVTVKADSETTEIQVVCDVRF